MNWFEKTKNRYLYSVLATLVCLVGFSSCINDVINEEPTPSEPQPQPEGSVKYASFRINQVGENSTRTGHDSDDGDGNSYFDKGIEAERALYIPEPPKEEEGDGTDTGSGSNSTTESEEDAQFYHFLILFDKDGKITTDLVPLTFDKDNINDKDAGITVYCKLYTPDSTDNPFVEDFQGRILMVLNASYKLQTALQEKIKTIDKSSEGGFKAISEFIGGGTTGFDVDNLLYLKDNKKESNFVTDSEGNRFLTMSSAMIVDESNNNIPRVDENNQFKYYNTEDEARNNPNSVYVERLASKYTVIFKVPNLADKYYYLTNAPTLSTSGTHTGTSYDPIDAYHIEIEIRDPQQQISVVNSYDRSSSIDNRNPVTVEKKNWKANIIGWDINGIEDSQYIFRNNETTKNWNEWGKRTYTDRTFWAKDPHYKTGVYPEQYREYPGSTMDFEKNLKDIAVLKYYDFPTLSKTELRRYGVENTFDESVLDSKKFNSGAFMRAGTHLIVTAQLLIEDFDANVYNSTDFDSEGLKINYSTRARSKYLMNNIYWSETAYKNYVAEYLAYFMLDQRYETVYGVNDGNFYVFYRNNYVLATASNFELAPANIKGGDGFVWLKPTEIIYIKRGDEYVPIYDPNPESEVEDLYTGLAESRPELFAGHFNEGRMYYAKGSSQYRDDSSKDDVKTGDFGTVRNTWYAYTVTKINLPGIPVSRPYQEIIPNNIPDNETIGMTLKVLDWHKIYTDVDISGQVRPGDTQ